MNENEKQCTKCNEIKPLTEFFKEKRNTGDKGKGVASRCKVCQTAAKHQWYLDNPNYYKQYNKDYYKNHKWESRLGKYDMTVADYDALFAKQGFCCAICGTTVNNQCGRDFHVDHDHKTGKVRGLLCHGCNSGIGNLKDNPEIVKKALEYLLNNQ